MRLLVLVCFLAALIALTEQGVDTRAARESYADRLLRVRSDDVNYVAIEREDEMIECARRDGEWFVTRPVRARADEVKLDQMLACIETLPRRETITETQRALRDLTLEDYGLSPPRMRLLLGSEVRRWEVLIGYDAPLGDSVYVRLPPAQDVIATSKDILGVLPRKAERLRDRTVIHGDAATTSRLEIQQARGGFIQIVRKDGEWVIQQPVSARADADRVRAMLDVLYSSRVAAFEWDPLEIQSEGDDASRGIRADTDAKIGSYGLGPDEAAVRIKVWTGGGEAGKELILGKKVGNDSGTQVYVKLSDSDSIYVLEHDVLTAFSVTMDDLRDRNLFDIDVEDVRYVCFKDAEGTLALERKGEKGWFIIEPITWKADQQVVDAVVRNATRARVESFHDGPHTNLAQYGLEPPAYLLCFAQVCPAPGSDTQTLSHAGATPAPAAPTNGISRSLLVGRPAEGKNTLFVKFEESDTVFEAPAEALKTTSSSPTDPLVYHDRTMLALSPEDVRSLSLIKGGKEQSVFKDEQGAWTARDSGTNVADREAVDDILFIAANMRALRIESRNPRNLPAYGLDESGATLTFGLSGEDGIRRTITMGFRAKTDGIYSMIQGQDIVFVLETGQVDRLTRDLLKPAPGAPPES